VRSGLFQETGNILDGTDMESYWNRSMATLTVKQVPADLLERLKQQAEANGRSMNREIIACLQAVVMPRERSAHELIAERTTLWADVGAPELPPYDPAWKREGRP
jgi:plasmid stability protein